MDDAALQDLWEGYRSDPAFDHIRRGGARLVPGIGQRPTNVMVVAGSPGAVETAHLRPFSGQKGRILQELMGLAGLRLDAEPNCWATYLVKYRVTETTFRDCYCSLPHMRKEWQLVGGPKMMVCVGAAPWLQLGPAAVGGLKSWAGQPLTMPGDRWCVGMFDPGYGMQYPQYQDAIERQWESLGDFLRELNLL